MKDDIKQGDEVRLITGGPVMTVTRIQDDQADCEWQVVDKTVTMTFKVKNLVLANNREPAF